MNKLNEKYIQEAAYYLWQNAGCPNGQNEYFWSLAIEQLSNNCSKSSCSKKSSSSSKSCAAKKSCSSKKSASSAKSSSSAKKSSK